MQTEIRQLSKDDLFAFKDTLRLFEDVFEMENFVLPPDEYLQNKLKDTGFLVFVAALDREIVGGLTAYVWSQYYSTQPVIYVYDLAVAVEQQRQGIGRALMQAVNNYGKLIGAEESFVQADEVDEHALSFYRSTGGSEEFVRHFTYRL